MPDSTPPKKDTQEEGAFREYEINLEMWKHFDNLRQEKSKTFLTAQTILIAVSGFVLKGQELSAALRGVVVAVSVLGALSSLFWLLLLTRNKAYIDFHRTRVEELEPHTGKHFTTFSKARVKFGGGLSSNTIDRGLAAVFALFWLALTLSFLFGLRW